MRAVRWLDRQLRNARFRRARPFVRAGDVVVDVGCADGALFSRWDDTIGPSIGYDPDIGTTTVAGRHELRPGVFPDDAADDLECDVITMLAVLEHVPTDRHAPLAAACAGALRAGGRVVVTVPSPFVDRILDVLGAIRLIDGMHTDEHYGFVPADTLAVFGGDEFELVTHRRFQLGLNNLFVFRRR